MGIGGEESQFRKEGKAEAIDAFAPLTQFFISQPHPAEKLGDNGGQGKISAEGGESGQSNLNPKT